ncbi:MAG: DUF1080 domain-containing protein [Acidobacteriota bacterium]
MRSQPGTIRRGFGSTHWAIQLVCLGGLVATFSCAPGNPPEGAREAGTSEPQWESLFDGSSTAAWRAYQRDSFPEQGWVIDGDALKTVPGGDIVDIVTRKEYRDFELILEWRVSAGGNSGIFFHATEDFPQVWQTGPEFQVLDDDRHPDGKDPLTSAGSLYGLIAPEGKALRPVGEFNQARVIVRGNAVEHWLNGVRVVEFELGSSHLRDLIGKSKFKNWPRFAQQPGGHVALQHHGQEVWYRNIRIREFSTP